VPDFGKTKREVPMSRFGFVFSVRFWVAVWIVILFVGLLPLPPAAELIILVGFVAHCLWFIQHRLRRAAGCGHSPGPQGPKRRSTAGCVAGGPSRTESRLRRSAAN
jgi:hypothetical protein